MLKWLIGLTILCSVLIQCATSVKNDELESVFPRMSDDAYAEIIETYTQTDEKYSGFDNLYQVSGLLLNSKVKMSTIQRMAYFMQWKKEQVAQAREDAFQQLSNQSVVFLSFFSPERDHNDLSKGSKSMWKAYLFHDGVRYEGKVDKLTMNATQINTLYPHHTAFSTPYYITFDVPMSRVERDATKFVLTSSLGHTEFVFPAVDVKTEFFH